ncbi:MAG: spermidine N1-acetyltransferase [Deltaproteobacteria bacterium]|nr:spermidine N1-acetyltransferase [Deltaproteobacteria bacterium]
MANDAIRLRPLEREDLRFVHGLDNDAAVMRYWFEEPYEAFVELEELYNKHIHDQNERRFIIDHGGTNIGMVELIEIDYIHRRAEFLIIVHPDFQNKGYATRATGLALAHAFNVLNMHKVYLLVDSENTRAIHVYEKLGFSREGLLRQEFFSNGRYRDVVRMSLFRSDFAKPAD